MILNRPPPALGVGHFQCSHGDLCSRSCTKERLFAEWPGAPISLFFGRDDYVSALNSHSDHRPRRFWLVA